MRILHMLTRFLDGGAERNTLDFMHWQVAAGHSVELAVGAASTEDGIPGWLPVHRVRHLVRRPDPFADIRAFREIGVLLRKGRFDVVHTHQAKAGILGREAARDLPVTRIHSIHGPSFVQANGALAAPVFLRAERHAARHTKAWISVGLEVRDLQLAAGIGRLEQYWVIRSPIDVDRFLRLRDLGEPERAALRQRLRISSTARVILGIGALDPRKRPIQLTEWVAPLLRRDAVLVLVGDGPLEAELRARAAALGIADHVVLPGRTDRTDEYFAVADVFAHASVNEGVSQVILQALAAGVPVVATDVCGLREVDEATIEIVPGSGKGFVERIDEMLANRSVRMTPAGSLRPWQASEIRDAIQAFHVGVLET
jgi:glycosyltransferase involved in cell wall biosynthesis